MVEVKLRRDIAIPEFSGMTQVQSRPKKLTRPEKAEATRRALIQAGMRVVSKVGYAKASVSLITAAAGLSQGTFYSYFDTRQHFLSELLPSEGKELLRKLGAAAHGVHGYFEHERQTFLAFFDFLSRNPHFLRVLTESETAAPQSHAEHMNNIEEHYVTTLRRADVEGEIRPQSEQESRVLAEILAGARGHIAVAIVKRTRKSKVKTYLTELDIKPAFAAKTYIKFTMSGLGSPGIGKVGPNRGSGIARSNANVHDSRTAILRSAARIIYERGFEFTAIAEVTQSAGVAIGTFYTYFPSRDNLLGEVLSYLRTEMLGHVRKAIHGSGSFLEVEQRGFRAFFDYLAVNPWYISVESESAVWANDSYMDHFADLTARYVASMKRAKLRGELAAYSERELPVLACIFMAARHYIATRYMLRNGTSQLPSLISKVYFDLLSRGLR
jgi:AcrR family transcriptional regulator